MNNVNKTLYIPLFGKALVSKKNILLRDPKAEEIWEAERFPLKGKSSSKWLAYYMAMRSAVFDTWLEEKMSEKPDALVIHIGCGMDSRILRVGNKGHQWADIDFPEVIAERSKYFAQTQSYQMIPADVRNLEWMGSFQRGANAIIIMEGVSMYLTLEELKHLFAAVSGYFGSVCLLMDCYTPLAAKASKYKNPINDVGVTQVYGLDDPSILDLKFLDEKEMTPEYLINQLHGMEKRIFQSIFAGSFSKRLYRLYEFSK